MGLDDHGGDLDPGAAPGESRVSKEWQMAEGPMHRRHTTRKKWMLRIADRERTADGRCAGCNERAPPAPIASRFSDAGLIEHTWCCIGCGNQWVTSTEAPS